jgi:4-diphosphocytidyl-2-C-methyl-D-erythritol kinase
LNPTLRLRAFAKINLGLKIIGKRPDGYHEIQTVYQTVALADRLRISLSSRPSPIRVECAEPRVPDGRLNLVYRACEMWSRVRKFQGHIHVRLEKRIPMGAGLGGASADAAAALLGLERLTGDRLSLESRLRLAARLGSDVPLFLWGGRVLGCGRGEEVYPLWDLPVRDCLAVFPGFSISTAWAYGQAGRAASLRLTGKAKGPNMNRFGAWSHFPLNDWGPAENDFEKVVFARWPELARLKRRLIRAGAESASLTGSGSAVFAVFDSARKLLRASSFIPEGWQTFRTRTLPRAEYERLVFA